AKEFKAPIDAYFKAPTYDFVNKQPVHLFMCAASHSRCPINTVRHYLNMKDANSMSNLHKHATKCWGDEAVKEACRTKDASIVRRSGILASGPFSGQIDKMFLHLGKGR
ncbi:hypothetical protein DFP72DRAFT_772138, partial [Ephemerocybe angulata]